MEPHRVGAVIVTYNRKALLRECLTALAAQTHALAGILVIDNAGTDGSGDMVRSEFAAVELVRMESNGGSAAGFHEGLRLASGRPWDWFWLMDDDTIAHPDALAQLLAAYGRFEPPYRPVMLASVPVWTDGQPHPHNLPGTRGLEPLGQLYAATRSTLLMRTASWVGLLLHRRCVAEYGLPYPQFFIWNDDVEYTARILRREVGVSVPASVVCHKTPTKTQAVYNSGPARFFYPVRNMIWMMKLPRSWSLAERLFLARSLLRLVARHMAFEHWSPRSFWAVFRGIAAGVFLWPELAAARPPAGVAVARQDKDGATVP